MNERWQKYRGYIQKYRMYIMAGVVLILLLIFYPKPKNDEPMVSSSESVSQTQSRVVEETASTQINGGYVDVKGEVKRPGMYAFDADSRVYDCIQKAGGLTKEADDKKIDYAQKVTDQMTLIIPKKGSRQKEIIRTPKQATPANAVTTSSDTSGKDGKININTATKEVLQTISGIGEKRAQDIIAYREAHGSFKTLDELDHISGIGEKTLAKLKEEVCL